MLDNVYLLLFQKRINDLPEYYLYLKSYEEIFDYSNKFKTEKESYRLSPIFSLSPEEVKLPQNKLFYIGFYINEDSYKVFTYLIEKLPKEKQKNLWFSHGLASLIVLSDDFKLLQDVKNLCLQNLIAYEYWKINKSKVKVIEKKILKKEYEKIEFVDIVDYSSLDDNNKLIIDSICHSLNLAINKAQVFSRRQLFIFNRLIQVINLLITKQLTYSNELKSYNNSSKTEEDLRKDRIELQKKINQITGHLVHINASLISLVGQAFTGTIPLLEPETGCPFRDYSLLGVGTAFNGILSFSIFIEKKFYKYPVNEVIRKEFPYEEGVEIFPKIYNYDSNSWKIKEDANIIDYILKNKSIDPIMDGKYNLLYFSPRLGFRESTFTITVPIQLLRFADSSHWHIITMSHEIMHAHVHSIQNAIFEKLGITLTEVIFKELYDDFLKNCKKENNNLLDSIRGIIFIYCGHKKKFLKSIKDLETLNKLPAEERKTEKNLKVDFELPTFEEFSKVFPEINREIDEIMTHIFDFNYFYNSNTELFLKVIWKTWSLVPHVLEKIKYYIFRSLITIGSRESGEPYDRFCQSFNNLKKVLELIQSEEPNNVTINVALHCLKKNKDELSLLFQHGIYLVDMTQNLLISTIIHASIFEDENSTIEDGTGTYKYNLETGEFKDIKIKSPVALISDRLRKKYIEYEKTQLGDHYIAAWLLLVLSSINIENGD